MYVVVATDGSQQSLRAAQQLTSFADPTKITDISVIAVGPQGPREGPVSGRRSTRSSRPPRS